MKSLLYFVIITTLIGCERKALSPSEYISWCRDESNGLLIKRSFDNIDLILQYKSLQYTKSLAWLRGDTNSIVLTKEDSSLFQFNLRLTSKTLEKNLLKSHTTDDGYFERINYFLQNAENDFKLTVGNSVYKCVLCHLEPNYGLAPQNTILLTFAPSIKDTHSSNEDLTFTYFDKLFNNGLIEIKLKGSDIKKAEAIKLNL